MQYTKIYKSRSSYSAKILFKFPKRAMWSYAKGTTQRVLHTTMPPKLILTPKQNMALWHGATRLTQNEAKVKMPLEKCPKLGFEIMPDKEYSNCETPHTILIDREFKNDSYYLCYGVFTHSKYPYNKILPLFISSTDLDGKEKAQYLHLYPAPRLIRKHAIEWDWLSTYSMSHKEYMEKLGKIKTIPVTEQT